MAKEKENFKNLNLNELKEKLSHLEEALRTLYFKVEGSKSKNVKEIASFKKQIARVLTAINQNKQKVIK